MASRKIGGLGKGLSALLGDDPIFESNDTEAQEKVLLVPLKSIDTNKEQPRKSFDENELYELSSSIKSFGVLQPIILISKGDRYQIVAGERRFRAASLAGLTEIPAIVREMDDKKQMEAALIENLQRSDLNPIEEANGIKALIDRCKLSQEEAAERLGKSRPAIANALRLLTLNPEVISMVSEGKLSQGHAKVLITLSKDRQLELAKLTVAFGWSVRQLEKAASTQNKAPEAKPKKEITLEMKSMEKMAREVFGTKCKFDGTKDKGRFFIEYENADDLQRIWDVIEYIKEAGK